MKWGGPWRIGNRGDGGEKPTTTADFHQVRIFIVRKHWGGGEASLAKFRATDAGQLPKIIQVHRRFRRHVEGKFT